MLTLFKKQLKYLRILESIHQYIFYKKKVKEKEILKKYVYRKNYRKKYLQYCYKAIKEIKISRAYIFTKFCQKKIKFLIIIFSSWP
jgi:hypothetical protein